MWTVHTHKPTPKGFDFQPKESVDLETREKSLVMSNPESPGTGRGSKTKQEEDEIPHCAVKT